MGNPLLIAKLMPDASAKRRWIKFGALQLALVMLILMVARPQMGTKVSNEKRNGIECIIAMDISNSMLAEDVAPSRLDRSKMIVENLVDKFSNDKIGLIVFAGDAFVQLPITSDYVSAKMFLSNIDPSMIATQGTDLAGAITMARHSFTQDTEVGKAIVIITDGEDHEGGALEAARAAKDAGMRVYVLGVGSTQGAPISLRGTGDYMMDNTGNTVMSALNEQMCREVAQAGAGAFIHVENNSRAQDQLDAELDKLSKKEIDSTVYSDFDEQFIAFGILALLLLVLEVCILESKNPLLKRVSLFKRSNKSQLVMRLLMLLLIPQFSIFVCEAQTDRQYIRQGNKLYRAGDFDKAEVSYRKALEKNERNPQAHYNLGNALLAQHKDSAAIEQFQEAAKIETDPLLKSQSFHNIGVVCQQHKMFGEAIDAYKQSLRLNPHDDETRYNLQLCKHQLKKQQQDNKDQQNKQDQDKKDQDKKDQQKQDRQKQDQQQQDKQKQQQQQQPEMSKENAEQLLNAAMQQEKQTQERMKKAQQKPQKRNLQKNW